MDIVVDTLKLLNVAKKIKTQEEKMLDEYLKIETLILSLNTEWQGNAEIAYASRIVFVKDNYMKMCKLFLKMANLFEKVSSDYEDYEKNTINQLNKI